jgi:transposase-like protein
MGQISTRSLTKEWPMPTCIAVQCPHCHRDHVVKRGKTARGTQRYLCQNTACATGSFLLDSHNRGCLPAVKARIIDMRRNASGMRDTARSLHSSTDTVLSALKKKEPALESVHTTLLSLLHPDEVTVHIARAGEAELDEMWSYVRRKSNPRWLWHAMDHHTGAVLASVFGRRQDAGFLKLGKDR